MNVMQPFTDPAAVARYADDTPRKVPGFAELQRMAMLLLAEHAPDAADILVLGAGGGLELKVFAEAQTGWRFAGVDPSTEMLALARRLLGPLGSRVQWQQGTIDDAPAGPFDGAACLLTLHFLAKEERLRTLREMRRRLRPGAPLIVAHHSCPQGGELHRWMARSAAFASTSGNFDQASASAAFMAEHLPILSVDEDEALLRKAGFSGIQLFYAGFTFRGWRAAA